MKQTNDLAFKGIVSINGQDIVEVECFGKYLVRLQRVKGMLVAGDPTEISTGRALQHNAIDKSIYHRAYKLAATKLKELNLKRGGQLTLL